jgi:hypothetical protein
VNKAFTASVGPSATVATSAELSPPTSKLALSTDGTDTDGADFHPPPPIHTPRDADTSSSAPSAATSTNLVDPITSETAQGAALDIPAGDLTSYQFDAPHIDGSEGDHEAAKDEAMNATLAKYAFFAESKNQSPQQSSEVAKPAPTGSDWTCDTCMLKNPPTATEKCTICESPRS